MLPPYLKLRKLADELGGKHTVRIAVQENLADLV